ncbi:MAG TPA: transcriptional repressor [Tissierellia bacterium]|jgi:Fur family peroxide stress response transcriptional regulator|nr:transcriptional repressor [Tissierellia bacterium]
MKKSLDELIKELKEKNIRLTHQRLKVLEYLVNNRTHPTVDQIYKALKKEVPSLSKTTIYNTLNYLSELKLIKVVAIEDNEARFDGDTGDHGHFKCNSCGKIYDLDMDMDKCIPENLNGFRIDEKIVHFKGICKRCLSR